MIPNPIQFNLPSLYLVCCVFFYPTHSLSLGANFAVTGVFFSIFNFFVPPLSISLSALWINLLLQFLTQVMFQICTPVSYASVLSLQATMELPEVQVFGLWQSSSSSASLPQDHSSCTSLKGEPCHQH